MRTQMSVLKITDLTLFMRVGVGLALELVCIFCLCQLCLAVAGL
jgi:hypothetical protein